MADLALKVTSRPPPPSVAGELAPGTTLDRYVILKRVGRGGMGVVYLAFDNELERRVAIKVLRPEAADAELAEETRARLLREAQAMAKVSHPNVVAVYDVGTVDEQVFVAMEYVSGATLREWQARPTGAARPPREVLDAYLQAGRGLEAAHAAGILHRDFKPENVLVDDRARVKVLDFGLARLEREAAGEAARGGAGIALFETGIDHRAALATPITRMGAILGTPGYMAPEQLVGETATARSDQFGFCVALYEALYGDLPFGGMTITERAGNIHAGRLKPVPKSAPRVPRGVRRALLRGMSGAPDRRFASMGELLGALERGARAPARRAMAGAAAVVGVGVVALGLARPARAPLCRGADQAIASAWSDGRAEEVRRAFVASGVDGAADTFVRAKGVLDRWAASWVAMRTDACEATRVRGEQSEEALDLRMACLQAQEKELRATVDLFARADAATVENAIRAASSLPSVESCVDVAALRAPYAPPRDEAQRRAVDDVRRRIADVVALDRAGRAADALPLATALEADAARAGYEPVHAEALRRKGETELDLDRADDANATLFDAALEAEAARDDEVAAASWIGLVRTAGRRFVGDDCARYARVADAAIRRVRGAPLLRADLLDAQSRCAYDFGANHDARRFEEEALAIDERALGPRHPTTLEARIELADAIWSEGAIEESLAIYDDAERALADVLGPTHPQTIRCIKARGESLTELGDYAGALETLERVRQMMGARASPYRAAYLRAVTGLALVGAGRVPEGIASFESALPTFFAERGGPTGVYVASQYGTMARMLAQRGACDEALGYAEKALAIEAAHGARDGEKTEPYAARALCRAQKGDTEGAVADADAALAPAERHLGERNDLLALLARGEARLAAPGERRTEDALADLRRAIALGDRYRGDPGVRARARADEARALAHAKR